jgi:hypothetical protein
MVEHRKHRDTFRLQNVKNEIGKPRYNGAPDSAVQNWICFRMGAHRFETLA